MKKKELETKKNVREIKNIFEIDMDRLEYTWVLLFVKYCF